MKNKKLALWAITTIFLLGACGEDDTTSDPTSGETNNAPTIANQSFTISENVNDVSTIGTVVANDPDEDVLSFSIIQNSNDLFEITTDGGVITLVSGQSLDFETSASHQLIIQVSDGSNLSSAIITVIVTDEDENNPPMITENQTFNASEIILDTDQIGIIEATDVDDDELFYSITEDLSDLFEITADGGVISLQEGKRLDFQTASSHSITVQVSDGKVGTTATVVVTVIDVDDNAFITVWEFNGTEKTIELPLYLSTVATTTNYDFTVDWGDGTTGEVTSFNDVDASHTYTENGNFIVIISGTLEGFNFLINSTSRTRITDVIQWGNVKLGNDGGIFFSCLSLEKFSASDTPDLTGITDMSNFFHNASSFNGEIGDWDVSNATNMSSMFDEARAFNQDIGNWDVRNVTNMNEMFRRAVAFNQDIGNWNVGMVQDMSEMFLFLDDDDPPAFNQNIGSWNVSNVTDMRSMFNGATAFDQDIGDWNVSNVTNMSEMFSGASAFNQNIGNWVVLKVTDMANMFNEASAFNQDISGWNVSNVVDMVAMFREAFAFNQNISGWNVGKVERMTVMFFDAIAFDQDISGWDTSSVTSCNNFVSINTPIDGTTKVPTIGPCFGI